MTKRTRGFCVSLNEAELRVLTNTAKRTRTSKCAVLREGLRLAAAQLGVSAEPSTKQGRSVDTTEAQGG